MTATLEGKVVTISSDGWTDVCGRAVINYMAVCGKLCYFLESVYTGDQAHDANFLAGDMQRVIEKYGFLDVGAVTTDNTATNKAMWTVLKTKYPRTFFHGCVCHALHLLVKDIVKKLPWLSRLQDGCKKLVAFFKNNHKLWSQLTTRLRNEKLRLLAKPGDTRWGSLQLCLETVLAAESILLNMVSARDFLVAKTKAKKKARRTVFDLVTSKDFVQQLQKAVSILKPIGISLKQLEKDDTSISLVYKLFKDLPSEMQKTGLTAPELKTVEVQIKARFKFVYGEAHGISYMLDPRYAGAGMDFETRSAVEDSLEAWFGEARSDEVVLEMTKFQTFLVEFRSKSKRRWQLLWDNKLPVYEFWCGLGQFPLLQGIAIQVFRCAASSSSSERNFSTHGYIHSKLRNRLSPDRVEKLVHIFFNAKNVNDEELAAYTHLEDLLCGDQEEDPSQDEAENRDDDFVYY